MNDKERLSQTGSNWVYSPAVGNALAGALSATQALLYGAEKDPAFRRDLLGGVETNLLYLRSVYENVLLAHSIQSGAFRILPRRVDFNLWLADLLKTWPGRSRTHEIRWDVLIQQDHPTAWIDQERTALALNNLLGIIAAHAPARSTLLVKGRLVDESIRVELSGQGEADLNALFAARHHRNPQNDDRLLQLWLQNAIEIAAAHAGSVEPLEPGTRSNALQITLAAGPR